MKLKKYSFRIYNDKTKNYETYEGTEAPSVMPSDGETLINENNISITQSVFKEYKSKGYILVEAGSSDDEAIHLNATNETSGISLNSGSSGISMSTSGPIMLSGSNAFLRGNIVKNQASHISLSDDDNTVRISDILNGILVITPTQNRNITLPSASDIIAGINGCRNNDSIEFTIINKSSNLSSATITLIEGTNGSILGNNKIASVSNVINSYFSSGSGLFRLKISTDSASYVVYRLS